MMTKANIHYISIAVLFSLFLSTYITTVNSKTFDFTVKQTICNPDGYQRPCTLINNQFPGPLIKVSKNDDITVNFVNSLGVKSTSLHWHGIEQRGTPYMDGSPTVTQCPVDPYTSFQYSFNVQNQVGTYWYHSHSGPQYYDGLFGPMIIDDPDDPYRGDYDEDIVVMIQDWAHDISDTVMAKLDAQIFPFIHYSSILINGNGRFDCPSNNGGGEFLNCVPQHSYTNFTVEHGKTYRIRVINTGTKNELIFSIDNHAFTVIEVDGKYVQPQVGDSIRVNLGQRYSLLMTANQTIDNYWMRAAFPIQPAGATLINDGLASISYVGANSNEYPTTTSTIANEVNVDILLPLSPSIALPSTLNITLDITSDFKAQKFYLNSTSYFPTSTPVYFDMLNDVRKFDTNIIALNENEVVRIILNNRSPTEHPFHLHGHYFQLLGTGAGVYSGEALNHKNPLVRDTQVIAKNAWTVLQFVADNPGAWFFHCHMDWHMEKGLALVFAEFGDLPKLPENFPQCGNYFNIEDDQ